MESEADLIGAFVTEVGMRQAWPYIQFCDNRAVRSRERRLYIDSPFVVHSGNREVAGREDATPLLPLNGCTVSSAGRRGTSIELDFDGECQLVVSGEGDALTTGDVWWFGPWVDS